MSHNCFIIHGTFGSPFENWFPWLSQELTKRGIKNIVPQFPIERTLHNYENWSQLLDYYFSLGLINDKTIFVCHSTGSIFLTKYLIKKRLNVNKLIFVSGVNNYIGGYPDFDEANKSFFCDNAEDIHKYCKEIISFYSDNDPYIPIDELKEFARTVAHQSIVIKNGGHINAESGYIKFPEILPFISE